MFDCKIDFSPTGEENGKVVHVNVCTILFEFVYVGTFWTWDLGGSNFRITQNEFFGMDPNGKTIVKEPIGCCCFYLAQQWSSDLISFDMGKFLIFLIKISFSLSFICQGR